MVLVISLRPAIPSTSCNGIVRVGVACAANPSNPSNLGAVNNPAEAQCRYKGGQQTSSRPALGVGRVRRTLGEPNY